ncbi:MAG: DUF6353 family protein [Flavonifractor plautii]
MKTNEIMKSVSLTFNKVGFQLQKKSPEILVAAGVVGVVVSAVMACQATPKALKVAEKTQDDVERIQSAEDSGVTQAGETYTKEDARGDRMQVYAHTGFQYIRLYAPAVLLGAASITCILTSHKLMRKRNMALAAAYATLDKHFKDYRGRVLERFGEQVEKELRYRPDEKPPLIHKADTKEKPDDKPNAGEDGDKPKDGDKSKGKEKPEDEETIEDVVNTMNEKQKKVMYALIAAAAEQVNDNAEDDEEEDPDDPDNKSDKSKGGNKTMKHNVFDTEDTQDTVLSHSDCADILALAKSSSVGSLRTALKIYADQNELKHGIDNIESLFPDYKDLRPGAPERVARDQGWVSVVMRKVHKSPISRIRTRQADTRKDSIRAHGYQKGKRKQLSGNMNVITRTTDPQTVYRTDALHRDDIIDITDFDVVEYQYAVMRENINEDVATAIMVGDGREPDDEMKISEDHIRSIWNDNDLYTIHYDVDIEAAKAELQGSKTSMSFGENYIYAEAVIAAALYAREKYKGTGTPDFFCTPHMVNVMLLARDMNGRRIYTSKADLAAALNVGELYTAEQFEGLVRMDDEGHKHKLLGIFVNLTDYTVGSTKGGEIARFDQFDIDFNQQKYLIETRLSGALTRVYSAIALEEPVAAFASGGTGGDGGAAGTP